MAKNKPDPKADPFLQRLESDAEHAPAFMFEKPGDQLVGTLVRYAEGFDPTYTHSHYPILVIRDEESGDQFSVHVFHPTLLTALKRERPAPGERIGVRYVDDRQNRAKTYTYKHFSLVVDREAGQASVPDLERYSPPETSGDLPF